MKTDAKVLIWLALIRLDYAQTGLIAAVFSFKVRPLKFIILLILLFYCVRAIFLWWKDMHNVHEYKFEIVKVFPFIVLDLDKLRWYCTKTYANIGKCL